MSKLPTTVVMKFGGAAVAAPEAFDRVADLILQSTRAHARVVVVVSAMGNTTNELIELAKRVNPDPPKREHDMLVSVGERISISLLAMALAKKEKEAVSFTGSQSGIITCARHTDARIVDVRPYRILSALDRGKVVIVAGFQGVSTEGEITTLGRGGSDTSAVALGIALEATHVEFYKDVAGIFEDDPKLFPEAAFHPSMSYSQALALTERGAKVLHSRCILLAQRNQIPLHVSSFEKHRDRFEEGTWVGDHKLKRIKPFVYESEEKK